jgi:two-component system response regulator PilR (NtrC family)
MRSRYRILVVDDEKTVLEVIHEMVVAQGYQCDSTTSPIEALQRVKKEKFDLVVLDVYMPEMSGMLFHAKLRMMDPDLYKHTIFISGYVSLAELREHLNSSPAFIEKPFKAKELVEVIAKVLPAKPRGGSGS